MMNNLLSRVPEMPLDHFEQASGANSDAGTNLLDAGSREWLAIDANLMIRSDRKLETRFYAGHRKIVI
jgi:hypothetical protein